MLRGLNLDRLNILPKTACQNIEIRERKLIERYQSDGSLLLLLVRPILPLVHLVLSVKPSKSPPGALFNCGPMLKLQCLKVDLKIRHPSLQSLERGMVLNVSNNSKAELRSLEFLKHLPSLLYYSVSCSTTM